MYARAPAYVSDHPGIGWRSQRQDLTPRRKVAKKKFLLLDFFASFAPQFIRRGGREICFLISSFEAPIADRVLEPHKARSDFSHPRKINTCSTPRLCLEI